MTPLLMTVFVLGGLALIVSPFFVVDRRAKRAAENRVWREPRAQSAPITVSQSIRAGRPEVFPVTETNHPTLATPQSEPELYYLLTDNGANLGVFAEFTTRFINKLIGPVGSEPSLEGDSELVGFFRKPDGEMIDRDRLTLHVTNFLIAATGGPKAYSGRALEIAHRPGKDGRAPVDPIDDDAFDRFLGLAAETLREMNVPGEWIGRVAEKLEPLRTLIVQA